MTMPAVPGQPQDRPLRIPRKDGRLLGFVAEARKRLTGGLVFDDRSPIYRQIADKLRDDIRQGVLKPDQPVMSTSQYATFYGVNPTTVARGFRLLVDEGLLYKLRGVGTFVSA